MGDKFEMIVSNRHRRYLNVGLDLDMQGLLWKCKGGKGTVGKGTGSLSVQGKGFGRISFSVSPISSKSLF